MNWKPISEAPDGHVYGRDADGAESWTWPEGGEWVRECWRETEDREEYRSEEFWSPIEFAADA